MIFIDSKVILISGGAGFLGSHFSKLIIKNNGIPVILDNSKYRIAKLEKTLQKFNSPYFVEKVDLTDEKKIKKVVSQVVKKFKKIDCIINNVASNQMYNVNDSKFERFKLANWNKDLEIGLTANFLVTKLVIPSMIKNKSGNIINISSDLGLIAPNQILYGKNRKPVTYSVVKHGIIGFSRYLSTYYNKYKIRSNAICPGGVEDGQNKKFIKKISKLIPNGRMAKINDYDGLLLYLLSDSSSYMNGAVISIDGGRTAW
tara:strand:- start:105 stop:878 length:774 start_codon:yes stop_codon:yes gene_type:complete